MFEIGSMQQGIALALTALLFLVKAFAAADCLGRSHSTFVVAGGLTKQAWLIILLLAVGAHLVWWNPLSLLNLAGTVAALVYLAQFRGSNR